MIKWNEVYFEHGKFLHVVLPKFGILCGEKPHAMYINKDTPDKFTRLPMCETCWRKLQYFM